MDIRERTVNAPILGVEDDDAIRQVIVELLQDEGYTVDIARDGLDALESAVHRRPSLMILDVMLPDIDGEGVAAGLRAAYGNVPILITSGLLLGTEQVHAAGAFAFLRKPFTADELLEGVRRGLLGARAI